MRKFDIDNDRFMYDGQPVRIISGAIHYFRVVPEYWEDRLIKLKACGFNTVETYVAWNIHEPQPGHFHFTGNADLVLFIEMAAKLDLFVIVRPSPYICSEWEFGGLPSWLLADPSMRLRCSHKPYLDKIDNYYDVLMPKLVPLLCTNGGPIIAMQIENEYGSYGTDSLYLEYLQRGMIERGIDVLLFTSDGPLDFSLRGGMVAGVWATVNFGSRVEEAFDKLKEYQPNKPLMCMEYWNGWFDHWGEEHHTREANDVAQVLDEMLTRGASVNFYMFHGGTNFGFYNGGNLSDKYEPTITSYDSDAPLNESGDITDKFIAIRDVISKHFNLPAMELPLPIPKKSYGIIQLNEQALLVDSLESLSTPVLSTYPETMETLGQDYGFILYSTHITGPRSGQLFIEEVRDRAMVYLNGVYQGVIERWNPESKLVLEIPREGAELSLLVENMGRVNFGPKLHDHKGIFDKVRIAGQYLFHWTNQPLPLVDLTGLTYHSPRQLQNTPAFYKGTFHVEEAADTFLDFEGWTKGVAFINGFNLGRYWNIGPQKTLYIPGPLLHQGQNEIILFELHGAKEHAVLLRDHSILG